ncbi:hypothetical protein HO133_000368 [Letharia lupina]|uniref:Spindle pole body-associated protein cut12 domain-containing protein n=1 Tax=Letharia lupina TaxID=560253 RepID=A0A8H6CHP1_9LECA|nr:uncharacterized protein HO133_000368 [Letharia lupina]KAF6223525.1 hypothetical protein HO133_000368 [Letharia lupina]
MLEWLTGSTRPADARYPRAGIQSEFVGIGIELTRRQDDGLSYIEEPPETPAPLFAVRAFKTAIFGTPHPDQNDVRHHMLPGEPKRDVAKTQPAAKVEGNQAHDAVNGYFDEPVALLKVDPLASPTKGILLTPGTGATRRKTVSFGTLISNAQKIKEQSPSTEANRDPALKKSNRPEMPEENSRIQPCHSSLTKTLIELSKQKPNNHSITSTEEGSTRESAASIGAHAGNSDQIADQTVDLSQPCSRSGQHWKTEYEQYHKRSNREMKKIIMYGQNVKSYAVKKDSEATGLGEKLKKELAKVAAMEKKVSKLAAQLNNIHAQGPEGESEQTRLVSELAQQTALAIRYKQKADQYRRAMQKENRADGSVGERDDIQAMEETDECSTKEANSPEIVARSAEKDMLHAQLESLRMSAKKAEDQAAKLEAENGALKRSLARVKGEMMSYESRRQAREERLKRREAKCKADQKVCEAQLAKLTVEHQNLLLASGQPSKAEGLAQPQPPACSDDLRGLDGNPKSSEGALATGDELDHGPVEQNRVSKVYLSPRKSRLQKSVVDIWTLSSPRDAVDGGSLSKLPPELPPSSVRHDIQRTLKEIDQNLIPEQHPGTKSNPKIHLSQANDAHKPPTQTTPQPQSGMSPPIHRTHNRRPTISSPRPATLDLTSSPAELEPSKAILRPSVKPSTATLGRSSSFTSRVGSRTSTMTSARGSALSAERAAAAKARLAARSAEKRKGREREG